MKQNNKARMEKLDEKYGDPVMRDLAKETRAAKNYYEMYLESERQIHISKIEATVAYLIAFALCVVSFWAPGFLISTAIFLIVATHSALEVRIETLWKMRFVDGIFDAVRVYNLEEAVDKLKKELKND